ncbi:MAG: carboxypeptidase-like regulatory domain-containing protein, partial [Candidatus Acidiferrales bacterium]
MLPSSKNSSGVSGVFFAALLAALFCLFTIIAPKAALAQSSSTGTVSGTVTDNTGAVVPDAAVTLIYQGTGNSRTATTTSSGQYIFAYVNPGSYDVKVAKQGFQ